MNSLTKMQKQIILGTVSAAFLLINILVFFVPAVNAVNDQRQTYSANINKINSLKDVEAQKESLKQRDKFYKRQFSEMSSKLPNSLVPEEFISVVKYYIDQSHMEASDITFTKPAEASFPQVKLNYPTSGPLAQQADSMIKALFTDDTDMGTKATEKELQSSEIPDEKAEKVDIGFAFAGTYEQIKSFIVSIESSLGNTQFSSISMAPVGDQGKTAGKITGTMSISFYGFKDSKIPVYNLWNQGLSKGKGNLFDKGTSARYDIEDLSMSDFDIALSPFTSGSPTVIMKKHSSTGSGIYGDNKGIETVNLDITEKGGKMFYRYKTNSMAYPPEYRLTEFTPVNSTDLIVKVYSAPRVRDDDNSGMKLIVTKPVDKNVKVEVYDDDNLRPRVDYVIK